MLCWAWRRRNISTALQGLRRHIKTEKQDSCVAVRQPHDGNAQDAVGLKAGGLPDLGRGSKAENVSEMTSQGSGTGAHDMQEQSLSSCQHRTHLELL